MTQASCIVRSECEPGAQRRYQNPRTRTEHAGGACIKATDCDELYLAQFDEGQIGRAGGQAKRAAKIATSCGPFRSTARR